MSKFADGIKSLVNSITNLRNPLTNNVTVGQRVDFTELNAMLKSGIGNKIASVKSGYAVRGADQFETKADREFFDNRLRADIREATKFMLGFGRCIILINERGADLSTPAKNPVNPNKVHFNVFSGDMVSVSQFNQDLSSKRYYKPTMYNVRGHNFHWTRVIDYTYVKPRELDLPSYFYGGISEFELIRDQLISDGIVSRSGAFMVEKGSRVVYKVKGFKEALMQGKEKDLVTYFSHLENLASVSTATLMDDEDSVDTLTMNLTQLAQVDTASLRRLAMVTGIPLPWLIGENVKGLNSTGDNERLIFWEMIADFYSTYIETPTNDLMARLGRGTVQYRNNNGTSEQEKLSYESSAIANAEKLNTMGEDSNAYLETKGVIEPDDFKTLFGDSDDVISIVKIIKDNKGNHAEMVKQIENFAQTSDWWA